MSFPNAHFTRFAKSPDAYKQFVPGDPIKSSLYDTNLECDASLRFQNRAILLVDSTDRKDNEEPNKYQVLFDKEYKDVIEIELQKADIPNSNYIVNEFNSCFYFQDSAEQLKPTCGRPWHTVCLPVGNYPIDHDCKDSIKSLLQQALNAVNVDNTYVVTVDPNQQTVTITQTSGSGIFNILFQRPQCCADQPKGKDKISNTLPKNMAKLLGFKISSNKTGSTSYTGEYLYDLFSAKYIILRINNQQVNWNRINSNHDPADGSFIIIPMDKRLNNFELADNCDQIDREIYKIHFNPPLPKLDRFNVDFRDEYGNPFNFRGRDHVMIYEITSLSRHSDYHEGLGKNG